MIQAFCTRKGMQVMVTVRSARGFQVAPTCRLFSWFSWCWIPRLPIRRALFTDIYLSFLFRWSTPNLKSFQIHQSFSSSLPSPPFSLPPSQPYCPHPESFLLQTGISQNNNKTFLHNLEVLGSRVLSRAPSANPLAKINLVLCFHQTNRSPD